MRSTRDQVPDWQNMDPDALRDWIANAHPGALDRFVAELEDAHAPLARAIETLDTELPKASAARELEAKRAKAAQIQDARAAAEERRDGLKDALAAVPMGPNHSRSSTMRNPTATRGWIPGHWSDVVKREIKALTPSGTVTVPSLTEGIARIEDRPTRLVDVIPFGPRLEGTDQFAFLRETVRTHAAAPVAKGDKKPTSTYDFVKIEDRARQVAHLTGPIHRNDLADVGELSFYIEQALRQGVMLELDRLLIHGDGTGEEFVGFAEDPDRLTILWNTDLFTTTRKAVTRLEAEEIYGGTFVLHPNVWETLELTADNEAVYYLGGPVNRANRTLWSAPVITSSVVAEARGFYVDFAGSTELREREGVRVDWSENVYDKDFDTGAGATDFERNLLRFRGEGRFGFAVKRPRGVIEFPTSGA